MMMSLDDDDDGVQISRNISAFCSASCAHQPGDDRAVCGVHLFRVAVHIFSSKIKPQCFNFPCEPLYFSFYSIYRSWGFAEADCGSVCCFCVCCASLRPAQFSVPAAHSAFWCVCAFLSVVFSLPSCPAVCIWLCFAWHKHAHFWKLSTLSYHVSINCWEPLKKKNKMLPSSFNRFSASSWPLGGLLDSNPNRKGDLFLPRVTESSLRFLFDSLHTRTSLWLQSWLSIAPAEAWNVCSSP